MTSSMLVSQSHCTLRQSKEILIDHETHPVDVEDVYVVRAQLLERCLDRDMQRLHVVPRVMDLLRNIRGSPLERRRILHATAISHPHKHTPRRRAGPSRWPTFVATTIWSRIPRDSIHSPKNSSDDSS